jgi:hypothetical protein
VPFRAYVLKLALKKLSYLQAPQGNQSPGDLALEKSGGEAEFFFALD